MPLDLARIHGLCFDIDGTLSDSDDAMVARVARRLQLFRRLLFGRTPEDVARRFIMGIETPGNFFMGLPDRLGLDASLNALSERVNRLQVQRLPQNFWLVPGVREALECLRPYFRMTVISARDERTCLAFLNQFGLLELFDGVASAQTCAHTKPYPDPVRWAAGQMGLSPADCLMIGDTVVDVRAGKSAGTQTCAVLCGFGELAELTRAGADLILPSTALLPAVLLPAPAP